MTSDPCPYCSRPLPPESDFKLIDNLQAITFNGHIVRFGAIRYGLLKLLYQNKGKIVRNEKIWNMLDNNGMEEKKSISHAAVHICLLRKTMKKYGMPYTIINTYSIGYVMLPEKTK